MEIQKYEMEYNASYSISIIKIFLTGSIQTHEARSNNTIDVIHTCLSIATHVIVKC